MQVSKTGFLLCMFKVKYYDSFFKRFHIHYLFAKININFLNQQLLTIQYFYNVYAKIKTQKLKYII